MANSVDQDETAPIGAVCSWPTLFASVLNSSVMIGSYLQQTTSADNIFRCIFYLALKGLKIQSLLKIVLKQTNMPFSVCLFSESEKSAAFHFLRASLMPTKAYAFCQS